MTATDDMFFAQEIDSGYSCVFGHPLRLVAEGYALCHGDGFWYPWRMTPPSWPIDEGWSLCDTIRGGVIDGYRWVSPGFLLREEAIDYIRRDIEAHRNLPFDDDAERSRLMPV